MDNFYKPLVTVAILCYNNCHFLKECLDSVLEQDYPNIQLIVSDDGSENFNKETFEKYIEEHKRKNIKDSFVHTMEKNGGTPKNFNFCYKKSKGDYIKFIAADDLFYETTSLSHLVTTIIQDNGQALISRVQNFDMYLENYIQDYPCDSHWNLMRSAASDKKTFFTINSQYCLISAPSSLFSKELLDHYNGVDESYRFIEDWPLWLKMIRDGKKFTFLNRVTSIYRSGGVSTSKTNTFYYSHQIEYADVIKKECLSHPEMIRSKEDLKRIKRSERRHRFNGEKLTINNKFLFFLKYIDIYFIEACGLVNLLIGGSLNEKKRSNFITGLLIFSIFFVTDTHDLLNFFSNDPRLDTIADFLSISGSISGLFLMLLSTFSITTVGLINLVKTIKFHK